MPEDDRLDTLAYTLARYRDNTPRLAYAGGEEWKVRARARLVELIGPPAERGPLGPKYGEPTRRTGHTRIPVTFATRDKLSAFGYLLIPDGLKAPAPAVICLPGHG